MNALRRNLMIALLVGIPAMAATDFRVWSDTSEEDPSTELPAPAVSPMEAKVRRLPAPQVEIGQQPWFADAQQQLRACGATYVRLERWNSEQPIFHFRCDLGSAHPRSFEAFSGSPRAAVQRVLSQATAWKASQEQRRAVTRSRPSSRPRLAEPNPGASWR